MAAPKNDEDYTLTALRECVPHTVGRLDLNGRTLAARVTDVYDADTITVVIPVAITPHGTGTGTGTGGLSTVRVRIMDIDANEMRGGTDAQRLAAVKARDFLINRIIAKNGSTPPPCDTLLLTRPARQALFAATPCIVTLHCDRFDKYGRVLARVVAPSDGVDYAEEMLEAGIVKAYVMRS